MLLAGLSETVLISGLLFAYTTLSANTSKTINRLLKLSLGITATAASFGIIRYFGFWDNITFHSGFSLLAKHLAMPIFINLCGWGIYRAPEKRMVKILIAMSIASLSINLFYTMGITADVVIILSLALLMQRVWHNLRGRIFVSLAFTLLLSTLLWNLLISEDSLRIAMFHVCLAGFYIAISLALAKPSKHFSALLD